MTLETALKHSIKQYLDLKGVFHWYSLAGIGAYKGIPDLFALHKGILYGIEVKAPKGVISIHQAEFGRRMVRAGGVFILAKSLDEIMGVF